MLSAALPVCRFFNKLQAQRALLGETWVWLVVILLLLDAPRLSSTFLHEDLDWNSLASSLLAAQNAA